MNNYSWLQQKLHQFALSSQFLREVTFDAERSLTPVFNDNDNHVFVTGLARSGTTALLNALYLSKEFASLSYQDMPFVLAPNLWSKLSSNNKSTDIIERAHGDGIMISSDSPEAFEEVFWMTFHEDDEDIQENFKNYVQLISQKCRQHRYLSKNNQNILRIELITKTFPNAKILIPFRNPIQHAYSLISQHRKFIEFSKKDKFISSYMKWIGHTEFGPNYIPIHGENLRFKNDFDFNHWLEQWLLVYYNCFETLRNRDNVYFICYEQLCYSEKYWLEILRILGMPQKYDFKFTESKIDLSLKFDDVIGDEASSLYEELSKLKNWK